VLTVNELAAKAAARTVEREARVPVCATR
jgi:hypothetical protein